MIERKIGKKLLELADKFPVVTITGPRQSGKTTLCKNTFPNFDYITLESIDNRQEAINDPRGFLDKYKSGVILDEIQRTPDLTSYIQEYVDNDKSKKLKFILTGSEQFKVTNSVNQSLAGRTAILRLLPFSYNEIYKEPTTEIPMEKILYTGFYPRIFDDNLNPTDALSAYVATYVERDVRSISNIKNITNFERFLSLCAANIGNLIDYTRFSNDIGVDQETIKSWLSVLEASYICFRLMPHQKNYRKRIIKSPKLYFYDVGLASFLLGIRDESQLINHPLKGNLFENFVIGDLMKSFWNSGDYRNLYFYRDSAGHELDLVFEDANKVNIIEIKSSKTITKDFFKGLEKYKNNYPEKTNNLFLVYGGEKEEVKYGVQVLSRLNVDKINDNKNYN